MATYTERMADEIRAALPKGTFTVEGKVEHWDGYVFITHTPTNKQLQVQPASVRDKRAVIQYREVAACLTIVRDRLRDTEIFTPEWQEIYRTILADFTPTCPGYPAW